MSCRIVDVHADDGEMLREIAQIHAEVIESGFLTTLGPQVLTDMYRTIAQSEGSFLLAAVSTEHKILGMLAGGKGSHLLYREFLSLRKTAAIVRLVSALIRPSRLYRMIETVRYSKKGSTHGQLPSAEILNFCIAHQAQRKGIGSQLMSAAEDRYRNAGISQVRIVTGEEQDSAQGFYAKHGAKRVGDIVVHQGASSAVYVWEIGNAG